MPWAVPVTGPITPKQVNAGYESATGAVIVAEVGERSPQEVPGVLVGGHGPFCWGASAAEAVEKAVTLEAIAKMAWLTVMLEPGVAPLEAHIVQRHFSRKHGPAAYYGQV